MLDDPGTSALPLAPQNLRILLVDDQNDLLEVFNLMLQRRFGYAVETAQSGQQAMEKAIDFSPHLVISDIGMPDMDGIELMENLRRLEGNQLSPFKAIALSGYDLNEDDRVFSCGYDAHFTKPVDFENLFIMLEQMALEMKAAHSKTSSTTSD